LEQRTIRLLTSCAFKDDSERVRLTAYARIAKSIGVRSVTAPGRMEILKHGLNDFDGFFYFFLLAA
jgi:hypothetical protein